MRYLHTADYEVDFPISDIVDLSEVDLTGMPVKVGYAILDSEPDKATFVDAVMVADLGEWFVHTTLGPSSAATLDPGYYMTYVQPNNGPVFETGAIEVY